MGHSSARSSRREKAKGETPYHFDPAWQKDYSSHGVVHHYTYETPATLEHQNFAQENDVLDPYGNGSHSVTYNCTSSEPYSATLRQNVQLNSSNQQPERLRYTHDAKEDEYNASVFDEQSRQGQELEDDYDEHGQFYSGDATPSETQEPGGTRKSSTISSEDYVNYNEYGYGPGQKVGTPSGADWASVSVRRKGSRKWVEVRHKYDTGNMTGLHLITERALYALGFTEGDMDTTVSSSFTAFGRRIWTLGAIPLSLLIRDSEPHPPRKLTVWFDVVTDDMSNNYDLVFTGDESQSLGEFLMTGFGHTQETPGR